MANAGRRATIKDILQATFWEPAMQKSTVADLVQAQPDEVDIDQLIEQLCLLRQFDCPETQLAEPALEAASLPRAECAVVQPL
jgi:hypothetical protein